MSAKNYRLIHNKTLPTFQYQNEPLQVNDQYQVYMSMQPNAVEQLILKDQAKPKTSILDKFMDTDKSRSRTAYNPGFLQQNSLKNEKPNQSVQFAENIQTPQQNYQNQNQNTINQLSKKTVTLKNLQQTLLFDERTNSVPKAAIQNHIIDDIVKNGDIILKQKGLLNQVQNLKRLKLLKQYEFNHYCLPGIGKSPYVFNDAHSKSTNPGYSRNKEGGKFFTR
ncbi:unnamed protein product [Paramecium octaurelia]|uniref:Uncharacterized protein n=1 Tax=Paramecium octaurelia TaxID=43137 RepID=A0A8S1T8J7_PAROT|nr:unnamed protein product [Paramecium octaurelia]